MNAEWVNSFYLKAAEFGMKALYAIVIIILGRWVALLLSRVVERTLAKSKIDATLANFLKNLCYFTILIFVFIAALNKLGVETTSFVALIGASGLAIGLALQGALSNFAAGVMVVIFHPFKVGDFIEAAGVSGVVTEIQIFNTIIIAGDKKIIIPNGKVTSDKIIVTLK